MIKIILTQEEYEYLCVGTVHKLSLPNPDDYFNVDVDIVLEKNVEKKGGE